MSLKKVQVEFFLEIAPQQLKRFSEEMTVRMPYVHAAPCAQLLKQKYHNFSHVISVKEIESENRNDNAGLPDISASSSASGGIFAKLFQWFLLLFTHPIGNGLMIVGSGSMLLDRLNGKPVESSLASNLTMLGVFAALFAINYYRIGGLWRK